MIFNFWRKPEIEEAAVREAHSSLERYRPRILISLDRSLYNLLGLPRITYCRLIRRAGGLPMLIDYGAGPEPEDVVSTAREIIKQGDALFLSGGSDVDPDLYDSSVRADRVNKRRDRFEVALIREAEKRNMPVFGICRGCQLLNVATGGSLQTIRHESALARVHTRGGLHGVTLDEGSHAARYAEGTHLEAVRSYHGQAVRTTGPGMTLVGRAVGDDMPEVIENKHDGSRSWMMGVQWHPELMLFETQDHRFVAEFVAQATAHAVDRNPEFDVELVEPARPIESTDSDGQKAGLAINPNDRDQSQAPEKERLEQFADMSDELWQKALDSTRREIESVGEEIRKLTRSQNQVFDSERALEMWEEKVGWREAEIEELKHREHLLLRARKVRES